MVSHYDLICISLMTDDIEHLFLCLLVISCILCNVCSNPWLVFKLGCIFIVE